MASKQAKKKNFSNGEIEVLLTEIKARGHIIFGSLGRGVTNKGKKIAWLCITDAINQVGLQGRTPAEIKKKWADLKSQCKIRIAAHRASVRATGGGRGVPDLSADDQRMAEIIGECAIKGVSVDGHGDTDTMCGEGESFYCCK